MHVKRWQDREVAGEFFVGDEVQNGARFVEGKGTHLCKKDVEVNLGNEVMMVLAKLRSI